MLKLGERALDFSKSKCIQLLKGQTFEFMPLPKLTNTQIQFVTVKVVNLLQCLEVVRHTFNERELSLFMSMVRGIRFSKIQVAQGNLGKSNECRVSLLS